MCPRHPAVTVTLPESSVTPLPLRTLSPIPYNQTIAENQKEKGLRSVHGRTHVRPFMVHPEPGRKEYEGMAAWLSQVICVIAIVAISALIVYTDPGSKDKEHRNSSKDQGVES